MGRRGGELVGLADDEGVEGVALVERLGARIGSRSAGPSPGPRAGAAAERRRSPSAAASAGPRAPGRRPMSVAPARGSASRDRSGACFVSFHSTANWSGRRRSGGPVEGDRLGRLEPGPDGMVWKFAMRLVEDALPCFFSGQLHRYSKTVGDFSRARDVTGRVWKSQCGLDRTENAKVSRSDGEGEQRVIRAQSHPERSEGSGCPSEAILRRAPVTRSLRMQPDDPLRWPPTPLDFTPFVN